jgi:hypothetical protein
MNIGELETFLTALRAAKKKAWSEAVAAGSKAINQYFVWPTEALPFTIR